MIDYDLELRRHNQAFRSALSIARTDKVLDIGCGAGETTREAARLASEGSALGVDISAEMIARARSSALPNVRYEQADVEHHAFAAGSCDVAISRFGTMFFADAAAAFSNIARALKPGGRLVMLVWQSHAHNEWAVEIQRAVATTGGQAFSLGDPEVTERILRAAGFAAIRFDEVHEPVYYGADVDSAFRFVSQFSTVQAALCALDAGARAAAEARLVRLLEQHQTSDGVLFDSRAWIIRGETDAA